NNRSKDCQLDKIDASAQSTTETTIIDPLSFLHSISESTIGIQKIERIKQLNMHIKTMDSEDAQSILNIGFCIELLELICDDQTHIQKELLSIPGSIAQIQQTRIAHSVKNIFFDAFNESGLLAKIEDIFSREMENELSNDNNSEVHYPEFIINLTQTILFIYTNKEPKTEIRSNCSKVIVSQI
ncbi:MAG: hypothetical protein EZS28_046764, partial [Streblomastix strix]